MNIKALVGSATAVGLLGLGMLAGSVVGSGGASAQTSSGSTPSPTQVAATPTPGSTQSAPTSPGKGTPGSTSITAKITQQQAEQAALTASPGNTIDHSILQDQNGTVVWDVDFTNGGGVIVNAMTGSVIKVEAAGTDQGGRPQAPSSTTTPTTQP